MPSSFYDLDAGSRQIRFSPEMLESLFDKGSISGACKATYLVVRDGKRWGDMHRLHDGDMLTLGRVASNDIPVADERCSRQHCALYQQGDDWFVRDLGSRNGTRLNGEKISEPKVIKSGDWIRIGKTKLLFTNDLSQTEKDPADTDMA